MESKSDFMGPERTFKGQKEIIQRATEKPFRETDMYILECCYALTGILCFTNFSVA